MNTPASLAPLIPLAPGAVIGILGGGQLGRMLALAASRLGFMVHIYGPENLCPGAQVTSWFTQGTWDDKQALRGFAHSVDVVTYEFENIPVDSVKTIAEITPVRPGVKALETAQDRLTEKEFISKTAGVPVAPYRTVDTTADLSAAIDQLGLPLVLKTRRMGYDGKGQVIIKDKAGASEAFTKLGAKGLIAEAFVPFIREVSIIAARTPGGQTASYPLIENQHENHILHKSLCPARRGNDKAQAYAETIMQKLDYVGVMATEFFELGDGQVLVNEIAPRVHNSGHWTQDGGCTDQFEQHIRAVAGWTLGAVEPRQPVEMTNLIGRDILGWQEIMKTPNARLHIYGKAEIHPGRKMGHVNRLLPQKPID